MSAEKSASVHWQGAGKEGKGEISTETGALNKAPYGFASRFGDDHKATNPEEILAAAHAACFAMAFSFACDGAGIKTETVDTTAKVRLMAEGGGFKISRIALVDFNNDCVNTSLAVARTVIPTGVAARWATSTFVPTEPCPAAR